MFRTHSVKCLAAVLMMLAMLLLSARRLHAQDTSPISDTQGVAIVNNLPIIWTTSNVWAGQSLDPPSVREVRTPGGDAIIARGIIAAFDRAVIWTATNVYLVTMPNLEIVEVLTPAGDSIVDTQGATTVGTPPRVPILWTRTNVYAIRLFTPLTVTEITRPDGSAISDARRVMGTPGIPIIWTPTNVYAARLLEPLDVVEIPTPGGTPIVDARGMAAVVSKPVIWTPTNVYAIHTLQPVEVREVLTPTLEPVRNTQAIAVLGSFSRAVIRTTSNVYGLVQIEPPRTNEILTPGNEPIAGARGVAVVSFIDRAIIWNATHVYGLVNITIPQTIEILEPTMNEPIGDVRGVEVIQNLGRALIWNAAHVYGLLNFTDESLTNAAANEIRTPEGEAIGGTQGAIEVEVVNSIGRAVIWNGTDVYGLLNISTGLVNEIRDPGGAPIGGTLDVQAIAAAGRAVIWNRTNVYALLNISIPVVVEILRPGGPSETFTLTVNPQGNGNGTVASTPAGVNCPPACSVNVAGGTAIDLLPSAAAGSVFVGWSGCDSLTDSTCTVTMNADRTVTATFNLQTFTLTVAKPGAGGGLVTSTPPGIACGSTCSASYDGGTQVTLAANPDTGSDFIGWSGCDSVAGNSCMVAMNTNRAVSATFELRPGTGLADVSLTVSDAPDPVVAGRTLTYSMTVDSTNPGQVPGLLLLYDEIPVNTTFQSLTVPDGWSCWTPNVGSRGWVVCWTSSRVPRASWTFTLNVRVNSGLRRNTHIRNIALVWPYGTPDSNASNNRVRTRTTVSNR
jgi:Divergent InlB B-repeat domain/Domain of unknown function DUF11